MPLHAHLYHCSKLFGSHDACNSLCMPLYTKASMEIIQGLLVVNGWGRIEVVCRAVPQTGVQERRCSTRWTHNQSRYIALCHSGPYTTVYSLCWEGIASRIPLQCDAGCLLRCSLGFSDHQTWGDPLHFSFLATQNWCLPVLASQTLVKDTSYINYCRIAYLNRKVVLNSGTDDGLRFRQMADPACADYSCRN